MLLLSDGHPTLPSAPGHWCCNVVYARVQEAVDLRLGCTLRSTLVLISLPQAGLQANVAENRKSLSPLRGQEEES